jgi:hypothetical protein
MSMPTPPVAPPGVTAADLALWRDAMRKVARWHSVATGKSSPHPRSMVVTAGGATGAALLVVEANLNRIATQIFVPAVATQLYWSLDSMFGTIDTTNNIAQFGEYAPPNSIIKFDQEYVGELWFLNAAAAGNAITIRVIELIADQTVWK